MATATDVACTTPETDPDRPLRFERRRLERFTVLLDSMFGRSGDGLHDHLLQFTRPVTGAYWFAPSVEDLAAVLEG